MNGPEFRNADGLIDTKAGQVECKTERMEGSFSSPLPHFKKLFYRVESVISRDISSLFCGVARNTNCAAGNFAFFPFLFQVRESYGRRIKVAASHPLRIGRFSRRNDMLHGGEKRIMIRRNLKIQRAKIQFEIK